MRLPTKGQYAVTAMLDIALHQNQGPVSLSDISERLGISISYLEQLFAKLRANQLVASTRGPGGGYHLNRSSSDIYIAEIIDAITGKNYQASPAENEAHQLWCGISEQIHAFLGTISLASALENTEILLDEAV